MCYTPRMPTILDVVDTSAKVLGVVVTTLPDPLGAKTRSLDLIYERGPKVILPWLH